MFENKNVRVDSTTITFKGFFGTGNAYKKDKIMGTNSQKFGVFGKILGILNMILIFNFSYGLHQFKGDVLVKVKINLNNLETKEHQIWVHTNELDQFMNSL
jgi:hypothetical protein